MGTSLVSKEKTPSTEELAAELKHGIKTLRDQLFDFLSRPWVSHPEKDCVEKDPHPRRAARV